MNPNSYCVRSENEKVSFSELHRLLGDEIFNLIKDCKDENNDGNLDDSLQQEYFNAAPAKEFSDEEIEIIRKQLKNEIVKNHSLSSEELKKFLADTREKQSVGNEENNEEEFLVVKRKK